MKTNREEILQNCLSVFATMNYERASITELSRACGLSRMAIHHYFPNKQAVFTAVVDRYVFGVQDPANKFGASEGSLADFIDNYLDGIVRTMRQIVGLCAGKTEGGGSRGPEFPLLQPDAPDPAVLSRRGAEIRTALPEDAHLLAQSRAAGR